MINYYQVLRQLKREQQLCGELIERLKACTWLFDTLPEDIRKEQARYDDFIVEAGAQGIDEPIPFDEWQQRWGGPDDEIQRND